MCVHFRLFVDDLIEDAIFTFFYISCLFSLSLVCLTLSNQTFSSHLFRKKIFALGNTPYGGVNLVDGVVRDGLTDAYDQIHMGVCTENLAQTFNITREETDEFARQSYQRAAKARDTGIHAKEIVPVIIPGRKGKPDVTVTDDEEIGKVNFDKIPYLNPVFRKDGTITAANASSLNDGAAACILMSETALSKYDYQPMAKVIGFADAAIEPKDFGIAPAYAIEKLLKKTGISKSQIAHWELNEAFSTVGLANIKKLGLEPSKVNPYGGAVSMGHPLGYVIHFIIHNLFFFSKILSFFYFIDVLVHVLSTF